MENKLIAIILLAIGSILIGQHSIVEMIGAWVLFWAFLFWIKSLIRNWIKTILLEKEEPYHREEVIGDEWAETEMSNDVSPAER